MTNLKARIYQQELKIQAKKTLISQSSKRLGLLAGFITGAILGYSISAKISAFKQSKTSTAFSLLSFAPILLKLL